MSTTTVASPRSAQLSDASFVARAEPLRDVLVVAIPCLLAAALVAYQLGTRSLWLDEGATVAITAQHGSALWHAIARDGGNMLGYYLLLHAVTGLFGHAPAVIRAPSAIASVGTVAIVCLIGLRLFGRRAALLAGLLTAVSAPFVFWGQDARGYALMIMSIAASFLALIAVLDGSGSKWAWGAYILATVLAMYMSFAAALIVPAQVLVLAARRERAREAMSALAVAAVCCVPIVVLAAARGSSQLFWVPPVSLKRVGEMARWVTSAGMPPNFHNTALGTLLLVLSLLALSAIVAAAIRARTRTSWQVWLVVAWLLVPLALSLAESLVGQPIALARNSLVALPACSLALAWGLTHPRVTPALGACAVAVLIALRAAVLAPSYAATPENWKAAAQHVLAATRTGDCIAFYPSDGRMAFGYYVGRAAPAPTPVLPATTWSQTVPYVERYVVPSGARLAQIEATCPRLWLVASHQGQRHGPTALQANYARYQELRSSLARAYGRGFSVSFGWASPVRVELFGRRAG